MVPLRAGGEGGPVERGRYESTPKLTGYMTEDPQTDSGGSRARSRPLRDPPLRRPSLRGRAT
jgi:hypothetical protein